MREEDIRERVHEYYWKDDINCARTMLLCLSELFYVKVNKETVTAAIGLHGAGGFRAQCGLVEGALMFIGIHYSQLGQREEVITQTCYEYAQAFEKSFGSLRCFDLRPNGFTPNDPPHMCEKLTCEAVAFAYHFLLDRQPAKDTAQVTRTSEELLQNIEQIHTTEMGIARIKQNLSLETEDVVTWCKEKIQRADATIYRQGKNWYIEVEHCKITVNAYSYTIITAHKTAHKTT